MNEEESRKIGEDLLDGLNKAIANQEKPLVEYKPMEKLKVCTQHYGVLIENMVDFGFMINPLVKNGHSGIIFDGTIIEVGDECVKCKEMKELYESKKIW